MRIFFWKYARGRNYPGYHLTADASGAAHLIERLSARLDDRLDRPIRFELSVPQERELSVPNNKRHIPVVTASELVVSIDFAASGNALSVTRDGDSLVVNMSETLVQPLMTGVEGLQQGEGDYAIWGDQKDASDGIWFWWRGKAD